MFCSKCGTSVPETAHFCVQCGQALQYVRPQLMPGPSTSSASSSCIDNHIYCAYWASKGECQKSNYRHYMLQNCPRSCKVCSGGVPCVNKYNDAYCQLHAKSCWKESYPVNLLVNCRKTCVCSCCSATLATTSSNATISTTALTAITKTKTITSTVTTITSTTITSTKVSTADQTTTESIRQRVTTDVTVPPSLDTHSAPPTEAGNNTSPPTTRNNYLGSTKNLLGRAGSSKLDAVMLSAIIVGVVVGISILALLLFCFWRKKRTENLQQPKKSFLPKMSTESPPTDDASAESVPNSPIYLVLERPNDTSTNESQAGLARTDRSRKRLRSETDYEEPSEQVTQTMIGLTSNTKENDIRYETIDENHTPRRIVNGQQASSSGVEYSYSYSVANEELSLGVSRKRQQEVPDRQDPRYDVLERPHTGYQGLQRSSRETRDDSCQQMRGIESNSYQALDKTTKTFYHPLKWTDKSPQK